jgi:hypothetical protein
MSGAQNQLIQIVRSRASQKPVPAAGGRPNSPEILPLDLCEFCQVQIGVVFEQVEQFRVGFPRSRPRTGLTHGVELIDVVLQNSDFVRDMLQ